MAEGGSEEKKTPTLKESLMEIFAKAKSALKPLRNSDSSLPTMNETKSEESESPISQKLWSSVKKLNNSASDFSNFTSRNWSMYFNSFSASPATSVYTTGDNSNSAEISDGNITDDTENKTKDDTGQYTENKTLEDDTEDTTWEDTEIDARADVKDESGPDENRKLRNDKENKIWHDTLHNVWDDIEPASNGVETHLTAYSWDCATPRKRFASTCTETSLSSPVSWEIEQMSMVWKVTPATPTPETVSNNSTPVDDQPVFDWSDFDWKEGESDPPRGLIFPFPVRPISHSESCHAIMMGTTGSSIFFHL